MRQLRSIDKALLAVLLPLWAVCFAASIRSALHPVAIPPVFVSIPAQETYPVVTRFRFQSARRDSALQVGDRLLRLGDTDLRGIEGLSFFARFVEATGDERSARALVERSGRRLEVAVRGSPARELIPLLPASLAFTIAGVLLLLRAPASASSRRFFLAYTVTGLFFAANFFATPAQACTAIALHGALMTLVGPLNLRAYLTFPEGVPPPPRWLQGAVWAFAALGPLHLSRFGVGLPPVGSRGASVGVLLFLVSLAAIVSYNYRRADLLGRRQVRWFMLGVYCAVLLPMAGAVLAAWHLGFRSLYIASLSALALIPLSLLVAVARYNLFDVDRLISATATLNLLAVLGLGAGFVAVPHLSSAASVRLGLDPITGQVLLALAVAGGAVAGHRALQPRIERLLFGNRHARELGFERLLYDLSTCDDSKALTERLGSGLVGLLRPESCVVYGRSAEAYAPLFVEGRAVPPVLESDGPLIASLQDRRGPLALGLSARGSHHAASPFEQAAVEALDAQVVVPVKPGADPFLLICLGPKQSGDVYTPTDLALLAGVADKVAAQLRGFDQAQVLRQSRAMQKALRRYVPGAVAEELARGAELEPGEREVSVLFVDIRGYTALARSRGATEIFSTVNAYTVAVSDVLRRYGGHVVEFNGDGLMAVFGAPRELPGKERAAVAAAGEILEAVAALPLGGDGGGRDMDTEAKGVSAGIGIATGSAYMGSIRSVDRLIWAVIGNTTNLAARLQALTRELGASIVIDEATRRGAGDAAERFEHRSGVTIRGLREPVDVYTRSS